MRLCRYDDNRLGLVRGDTVHDVTGALDLLPACRWPLPAGDLLVANLDRLRPEIERRAAGAPGKPVGSVKLLSPVANPTKIIGAPINYDDHLDEAKKDQGIAYGRKLKHISEFGLFLKANTTLVGPGEGVALRFLDRRNDHEGELAAIIGKPANNVPTARALDYVAGYAIGLDMTVRGPEVPSFRKSVDSYSVLGPWLVTADEIADPNALDLELKVNGETRQKSNTRYLVYNVQRLIEYASSYYTLMPGDIIMTGTPAGVGPVAPGDTMTATIEGVGEMAVKVRAA
ncbi:MAG: fumarylacetoacetate hydrolase family protein [Rhodospirillales bacterium]|nr:fumarylacetoacetate hydrolase family protein [Rhodospirillales bacterium]